MKTTKMPKFFFWEHLRLYKGFIVVAFVFAVLLGIVSTFLACLMGPGLKVLLFSESQSTLLVADLFSKTLLQYLIVFFPQKEIAVKSLFQVIPIIVLALGFLKAIFHFTQTIIWEILSEVVAQNIRTEILSSYLKSDKYHPKKSRQQDPSQEIVSALTNDTKILKEYISHFYGGVPRELFQIVFLCIILMLLSFRLFVVFLVLLAPAFVLLRFLGKKLKKRYSVALSYYAYLSEWLQQRLLGLETIKQFKTEAVEVKKMSELNYVFYKKFLKSEKTKARVSPVLETCAFMSFVFILALVFYDTQSERLSGSVAISFFFAVGIMAQSISTLGRYFNSNKEGAAVFSRLQKLQISLSNIQRKSIVKENFFVSLKRESIVCDNLSLSYPNSNSLVIKNFCYSFEKGKLYSIIGASGCGKSTLIKGLSGLIAATSGNVYYGCDKKNRLFMGYVPQSFYLLPGSIEKNICYPDPFADQKKLSEAIRQVGLCALVSRLKDGVKTYVGAGDTHGISGGEAQRVKLARIFYHKFSIVFIDEGTSALDQKNEELIFKNLKKLIKNNNLTCLQVSHRPHCKAYSDHVICLNNGEMVSSL